eukprot:4757921-Amphidinium_carterae.1
MQGRPAVARDDLDDHAWEEDYSTGCTEQRAHRDPRTHFHQLLIRPPKLNPRTALAMPTRPKTQSLERCIPRALCVMGCAQKVSNGG